MPSVVLVDRSNYLRPSHPDAKSRLFARDDFYARAWHRALIGEMFSFVRGILRPRLPYQDPDRLVLVEAEHDVSGVREPVRSYFSIGDLDIFRRLSSVVGCLFCNRSGCAIKQRLD